VSTTDSESAPPVEVHRAASRQECEERALVLAAMEIPCVLEADASGWVLTVRAGHATRAAEAMRLYTAENPPPRAAPPAVPGVSTGLIGALTVALVLLMVDSLRLAGAFGVDWRAAGALAGAQVRAGDWWRCVTALTLHADLPHLTGNLAFGLLFGVLGGALGNALDALLQPPARISLGASTAVFAALGIVVVLAWHHRRSITSGLRRRAPLVAGVVLLAWLGTGDARTDVVAHLAGFCAGIALGMPLARGTGRLARCQTCCGLAALGLVAGCWALALAA